MNVRGVLGTKITCSGGATWLRHKVLERALATSLTHHRQVAPRGKYERYAASCEGQLSGEAEGECASLATAERGAQADVEAVANAPRWSHRRWSR